MKDSAQRTGQQEISDVTAPPPPQRPGTPVHRVVIYVTAHCANCSYAWEIGDLIQREYPHVAVQMVDLASSQEPVPESVFATPTYMLDDRVWFLGNPSPQQVRDTLNGLERTSGRATPVE